MKNLMEYILKQTDNAYYNVKLVGVVYNNETGKTCFRFIYHDRNFTQADKSRLLELVESFYNNTVLVEVKVKRDYIDAEVAHDIAYRYLFDNYTSIQNDISKSNVKVNMGDDVEVNVNVPKPIYEYLQSKNFESTLSEHLHSNSFATFRVVLNLADEQTKFEKVLNQNEQTILQSIANETAGLRPSKFEVTNVTKLIGEELTTEAFDVASLKGAMQKCQIAGNVRYFMERSFKSKRPDANGNYPEKKYYSWNLQYGQASMQCVYFPLKADADKPLELVENMPLIVGGDVEEYNGRINFKVKSISTCTLPEVKEVEVKQRKVNEEYLYVKPQPVESFEQFNFFDVPEAPNEFLANNDIVVFDVETTGLDYKTNEIIEIGAVKMQNGQITESFSCFVKPTKSIPKEITNLTGITNEMVKDAYSISEVIVDFYKFCYGCVIVAYNIDFDYKFINAAGSKVGYKFTNRQIDALYLARKNVKGAKTFTLGSIAKRLGVSLEGAHRAINDATATAEVFKLICDNIS